MTKAELMAAFPGQVQQLPQPTSFAPQIAGSTDVAIPSHDIGGTPFRVLFGFEADALNRIYLSASKAADDTCFTLEKQLTEKHAAPSDRSTTRTNLKTDVILWNRPAETITLTCAEAPGLGYRTVTLDYAAAAKP